MIWITLILVFSCSYWLLPLPAAVEPKHGCFAANSQHDTLWMLERLFANAVIATAQGHQSEPWQRFAISKRAELARHRANQCRGALRPSWQAIFPATAASCKSTKKARTT